MARHSYEDRLLRVLDHVYAHLDGDLSLDTLADVAALSRFHFHRVFSAMTGETVAGFIRRVRLYKASHLLVQGEDEIERIAQLCGYPNPRSFARAFSGCLWTDAHRLSDARCRDAASAAHGKRRLRYV